MSAIRPDTLSRTAKLEWDEGRASTAAEAERIVGGYVLQIEAGAGVIGSETRQAMLLTAVNAAARAFPGGVRVRLRDDGPMAVRWAEGRSLSESVADFGGTLAGSLQPGYPTLVIGDADGDPPGSVVLHATWQGWAGGVVEAAARRLSESSGFPLAGVLAGAFGVSEAFQHVRGYALAGRRPAGLSLWRPDSDWLTEDAWGDPCPWLPARLWLVGLGHLGQAYAWALGMLPYEDPADADLVLQDPDCVEEANRSTGMLSGAPAVGRRKTRVAAGHLERLGFRTAIAELPFGPGTRRRGDEPGIALAGVDNPEARRSIAGAGFDLTVDAGLGGRAQSYLDILLHCFPSGLAAEDAWPVRQGSPADALAARPAYRDLGRRLAETTDQTEGEIECGVIDLAGRSVGAAFVGCAAAALVLSEVLRLLAGGPRFGVLNLPLRSPHMPKVALNDHPGSAVNPGFVRARPVS